MARWVLGLTQDSFSEIAITLLAPYIAWVLAEQAHGSAALACVAGGLYLRRHFSSIVAPATRIQARAVWDLLVFVLNGFIFILIGLRLGALRGAVPSGELGPLILIGALVKCDSHRGAHAVGAGSCLGVAIGESLVAGARSDATLVASVPHRLDRHARDRIPRGGLGPTADHCRRDSLSVSCGDHPHHLHGDSGYLGIAGPVASSADPRLEYTGRPRL